MDIEFSYCNYWNNNYYIKVNNIIVGEKHLQIRIRRDDKNKEIQFWQ